MLRKHIRLILLMTTPAMLGVACTHKPKLVPYGTPEEHSGYVPARIAVLPCRTWPDSAGFEKRPLTNVTDEDLDALCKNYSQFVIDGFKDQPYMRGFSPKSTLALLSAAEQENLLNEFNSHWQHTDTDCQKCENTSSFYVQSIQNREGWRLWLSSLSKAVRNADAIMVPFVYYMYEKTYLDRGLLISKRAAGVSLFLIDTNNGYLLWSGGREAFANDQLLVGSNANQKGTWPAWTQVEERLFIEEVWRDFPGRQVYK